MTQLTPELRVCGSCGGQAALHTRRRGNNRRTGNNYQVVCNKCHTRGPLTRNDPAKAAEDWNTLMQCCGSPRIDHKTHPDRLRGHPMYQDDNGVWRFIDTDEPTETTWFNRPCGHCGLYGNSSEGKPDPCLGDLAGVTNACCGHGTPSEAYICFMGGLVIRGFTIDREYHRTIGDDEHALILEHNEARHQFQK